VCGENLIYLGEGCNFKNIRAGCGGVHPGYSGGRDGEDQGYQDSPGEKVFKTPTQPISRSWWQVPVIPAVQEMEEGRSRSKASRGGKKSMRPYMKNS
jgi:hypothetical protein